MSTSSSGALIELNTREQLLYALAEAAEVEHCLMCTYLYAVFSLKGADALDLDAEERAAVQRWRRELLGIAVEEMTHLTLVSNLMVAIGGGPHFGRPNFPVGSGYFPSGVVARLEAFSVDTLKHFVFLERPESLAVQDGAGFGHADYVRPSLHGRMMPSAQDYATVGELYRALRAGLVALCEKVGEAACFPGRDSSQVGAQDMGLPGITAIRDLASALQALDTIVDQGEGTAQAHERAHYTRFAKVLAELEAMIEKRPGFKPAHPVASSPVMRKPPVAEGRVWVTAAQTVPVLDLANAAYALMLRLLVQSFGRPIGHEAAKSSLLDASVQIMHAITPLAAYLATLPASDEAASPTAGISFATLRSVTPLPFGEGEWRTLSERASELARQARQLAAMHPPLDTIVGVLERVASRMQAHLGERVVTQIEAAPLPAAPAMESSTTDAGVERIAGQAIDLLFEGRRCIHHRQCVLGQPEVFKANTPGAWIFPNKTDADTLAALAHACPSGAIRYQRKDGKPDEPAPAVNTIRIRENGPLAINAPLCLNGRAIGHRATLCRCGASQNKPFCDGSHNSIGFHATGEPPSQESAPLAVRSGELSLRPQANGPMVVEGNLEICCNTGRTVARLSAARLCRCGGSANKPFCDGTHARNGFAAEGE